MIDLIDEFGCGAEQVAVVPAVGVAFLGILVYIFAVTWKVVRDRSKLDQLVRLALQEAADEAIETQAQKTEASGIAQNVTQALQESRVLVLDLSQYHSARSQWRCMSKMFTGACLVAATQPGSVDLVYSACRMLVLGLLWVQHEGSTSALQSGAVLVAERLATASRGLGVLSRNSRKNGIKRPSKMPVALSGLRRISSWSVWKHRLGVCVIHASTLAVLVFFEAYRHPILREEACPADGELLAAVPMLLSGRAASLTLFAAWMLAVLSHACLLECEACIWLAPKAQERVQGLLQAHRGGSFSMGRGLELAEALCGAAGHHLADTLVRELHDGYGVTVLCEGVALAPKPVVDPLGLGAVLQRASLETQLVATDAQLTQKEFAAFRMELQAEVRRSLSLSESRISEVLKSNEAMVKAMEGHLESMSIADAAPGERKPLRTASSPVDFMPGARSQSLADKTSDRIVRRERKSSRRSVTGRSLDNQLATADVPQEKRDANEDRHVYAKLDAGIGAQSAGAGPNSSSAGAGNDAAAATISSPTTETVRDNLKALQLALSEAGGATAEATEVGDTSPVSRPRLDLSESFDNLQDDEIKSRSAAASSQPPSNFGPRPRPSQTNQGGRRRVSERATPPRQSRPALAQSPVISGSPSPVMVRETPPPQPVGSRVARPSTGRTSMRGSLKPSPEGEAERDLSERPGNRPSLRGVMNGGPMLGDSERNELERLRSSLIAHEPDASETHWGALGGGGARDASERRYASRPRPSVQGRRASASREKDEDQEEGALVPRRSVGFRDEDNMEIHENPGWPISMF